MDFTKYQKEAQKTIQPYVDNKEVDSIVPFLGIVGETGSVITELKKKIRDGDGYENFENQLSEELGDVLWYVATIASNYNLSLEKIAKDNIKKTLERFSSLDEKDYKILDEKYPKAERFPDEFEVKFEEQKKDGKVTLHLFDKDGRPIGDPLTDNSYEDDGYRYHDIFHFGYVAYLGWSPVVRELMGLKRKSDESVDEIEDGARAKITEELISLYIYSVAQRHSLFKYSDRVDSETLRTIQYLASKVEVRVCTAKQWEDTIIRSYEVFDKLRKDKGGRVLVSVKNRKLIHIGKH